MGNIINDLNDAIDSLKEGLRYILLIGIAILILWYVSIWYLDNQSTVNQSIAELCGLDQTIRNNIDQSLIDTLPVETWQQVQTKSILKKALHGELILDSEYQIVFDVLSITHKKKLNIGDLEISCNLIG